MRKIGIIGGTGIYSPEALKGFKKKIINTPYGKALCNMALSRARNPEILCVNCACRASTQGSVKGLAACLRASQQKRSTFRKIPWQKLL